MNIADFLRKNSAVVSAIAKNHILPEDVELLGMYDEARRLIDAGEKTSFVAALGTVACPYRKGRTGAFCGACLPFFRAQMSMTCATWSLKPESHLTRR